MPVTNSRAAQTGLHEPIGHSLHASVGASSPGLGARSRMVVGLVPVPGGDTAPPCGEREPGAVLSGVDAGPARAARSQNLRAFRPGLAGSRLAVARQAGGDPPAA